MLPRLVFLLVLLPATAFGATTQDLYLKLWAKRAMDVNNPDTFLKPKAACACQDGSIYHAQPGALLRDNGVLFSCLVPFFSAEGILTGYHNCLTFEYIGK